MQIARNIIWLASYPKSGNTWLRLFLAAYLTDTPGGGGGVDLDILAKLCPSEASRAYFERHGLGDVSDVAATYALRPRVQRAISEATKGFQFLKTHLARASLGERLTIDERVTARSIYVVRNPFDVAVSMAHFFDIPVGEAVDGLLFDQAFLAAGDRECHQFLGSWASHVGGWLTHSASPVLRVRYEDLLDDPPAQFRRVLAFLGIERDEARLQRAVEASSFDNAAASERQSGFSERPAQARRFFRKGRSNAFREEMDRESIERLDRALRPVLKTLYPELGQTV